MQVVKERGGRERERGEEGETRVGWISITSRPENLRGSLSLASNESEPRLDFFFTFSFLPPPSSHEKATLRSPRNGNSRDTSSVSNCREVT